LPNQQIQSTEGLTEKFAEYNYIYYIYYNTVRHYCTQIKMSVGMFLKLHVGLDFDNDYNN